MVGLTASRYYDDKLLGLAEMFGCGLTVVRLLGRQGSRLFVRGVDMLDGTPIVDLKPYLSSVPAEEIRRGWIADAEARQS